MRNPSIVAFPPREPLGSSVVALGAFDGVHIGHRRLLEQARAEAQSRGVLTVALTFDRDPDEIVNPSAQLHRLLDADERFSRLQSAGADVVLVVEFTDALASMDPRSFLDTVVSRCCEPVAVHVGQGFRFGAGGSGDTETLKAWGHDHDVEIRVHPLERIDGDVVSSTRIRTLVAAGAVEHAARMLSAPHRVTGTVTGGRGYGTQLGFATANVCASADAAVPADGVYAGRVHVPHGGVWPAAISVGAPPTFPGAERFIEAHLIGFSGDLYGKTISVEFWSRLRDLRAFSTSADLRDAIADDVTKTLAIVNGPEQPATDIPPEDPSIVDDPIALERATREAAQSSRRALLPDVTAE